MKNKKKFPSITCASVLGAAVTASAYTLAAFRTTIKRRRSDSHLTASSRDSLIFTESFDGLRLAAHWFPSENPQRIIIAMHGWRSSWQKDFSPVSDFLKRSGCSVLYAEQRSHGASEGEYISYGILERHDVVSWAEYVNDHLNTGLPVYLYGVSMGAATVMMSSELEFPLSLHGIIADCGYTSPEEIIKAAAREWHMPYRLAYPVIARLSNRALGHSLSELNIPDILRHNSIPILFIHGSADDFVPLEMTLENYEACAGAKELLIVDGARHAQSYAANPEKYESTLTDFFAKHDAKS